MIATDALKKDHRVIEKMLRLLESASKKLENGENVPVDILNKALDFIRNFADNYHHGKEEDILFKIMGEKGFAKEGGPIAVMLDEHNTGRGYTRALSEGIDKYASGDINAIKEIAENARNYTRLLATHIMKEDNILYTMADKILPEDQQEELLNKFAAAEMDQLGIELLQYYLNMPDQLIKSIT
ncbi:MAG: hemerythrin domain-containing protein [Nitrospirae bacterium]|nr:hemerythrin domain-containing protein [Nitrospirota bacterium]